MDAPSANFQLTQKWLFWMMMKWWRQKKVKDSLRGYGSLGCMKAGQYHINAMLPLGATSIHESPISMSLPEDLHITMHKKWFRHTQCCFEPSEPTRTYLNRAVSDTLGRESEKS